MKLIMENWRRYINEAKNKNVVLDPASNALVALYEDFYFRFRHKFIKIVLLDRKEEIKNLLKDKLGPVKTKIYPISHITKWFIDGIIEHIEKTKIEFYETDTEGEDPHPYGGPAFYERYSNLIGVEKFRKYWAGNVGDECPDHPSCVGHLKRNYLPDFEHMIYHELGHAVDAGIQLSLRKVASLSSKLEKPSFYDPEKAQSIFDFSGSEILGLANAILEPLGKEIRAVVSRGQTTVGTPWSEATGQWGLDRGHPAATNVRTDIPGQYRGKSEGFYSRAQYEKLLTITNKRLSRYGTDLHEEHVVEFFASLREIVARFKRNILPLDIRVMCLYKNTPVFDETGERAGGEDINPAWEDLIIQWVQTLPMDLLKDLPSEPTQRGEVPPERRAGYWAYKMAIANEADWHISILSRSETMRMIDCSKDPNFVAEVLNDMF